MTIQHPSQFFVHGFLRRRRDPKQQNTGRFPTNENEPAKVTISRHEDAVPIVGFLQELPVWSPGQSGVGRRNHVVPPFSQGAQGIRPHVLIGQESHEDEEVT